MATEKQLSFEDVNAHVEQHFTTEKQKSLTVAPDLCGIWTIVKPILTFIIKFLPKKWGDAIKILIAALDVLCPGH